MLCKNNFEVEPYETTPMATRYRSALARLRCGILPLEIEVGRYNGIPEERRICKLCDLGVVESELHFLFKCPINHNLRQEFINTVKNSYPDVARLPDTSKFQVIKNSDVVKDTARYVYSALMRRHDCLYRTVLH